MISKVSQTDNIDEFKRLYYEKPSLLYLKDEKKKWLPIHYAAFNSKIKIIEFILEKSDARMKFKYIFSNFNYV